MPLYAVIAELHGDGSPITVYLTNQIGTGTTTVNQITKGTFVPPENAAQMINTVSVLSGLTLGPGNYYLIFEPQVTSSIAGFWCYAKPATIATGTGVTRIGDYTATSLNYPYYPASTFALQTTNFEISVTGTLVATSSPPLPPSISSGGIVPVDGSSPVIQSGEWASIFGTNLANTTANWTENFPTTLGGTTVEINGTFAYLLFVSPTQINFQVPDDTATGTVSVVVTTTVGRTTSTVTLAKFSPTFFLLDSKHVAGIILRSNGSGAYGGGTYDIIGPTGSSLGYKTVAAKAGDVIELYGTGFGPTSPTVAAGQTISGAIPTSNPVTLRINTTNVTPTFAGLSGAGLDQINLVVPSGLGTGDVPLQATVGGISTPTGVMISLQ